MLIYKGVRYLSGDRVSATIEGVNVTGKIFILGTKCWLTHNNGGFDGDKSPELFGYSYSWTFNSQGDYLSDGVVLIENYDAFDVLGFSVNINTQLSPNLSRFIANTILSFNNNINISYLFSLLSYRLILRDYYKMGISKNNGMITLENDKGRKMEIKIGRYLTQTLLEYNKVKNTKTISVGEKDIEIITNLFISYQSSEQVILEYLSGEDIKKGYISDNCINESTLSKSCMMNKTQLLNLYTKNKDVRLLVAKLNGKIIGRSIIWKLDNGMTYMDRVYSSYDWVSNIFCNEAYNNKYLTSPSKEYFIKLENHKLDQYPYMDTFSYLSENGFLYFSPKTWTKKSKYNTTTKLTRKYKSLRNTDGHHAIVHI